jgi:hypothetical protein
MGSTPMISEIRVWHFLYLLRKAKNVASRSKDETGSIFDQIRSRGRKWSLI